MKRMSLTILPLLFCLTCLHAAPSAAVMEDYCQIPPFVVQNVAPNIMIIMDNSGSMLTFAYRDGFHTPSDNSDNRSCSNTGSNLCTGYTLPGTYPTYKYYGYFDPDAWYIYDAAENLFDWDADKASQTTIATGQWDGNFLNWLTMRRMDVMRRATTGGKFTNSGETAGKSRLLGEQNSSNLYGTYKQIDNAENYTPYTGTVLFTFDTGSGGSDSLFTVSTTTDVRYVRVRVNQPVEGVLQKVVGTKARVGLTFFNGDDGGEVDVIVRPDSLADVINGINTTRPGGVTPLSETLWTVTGYFAQDDSAVNSRGPRYRSDAYTVHSSWDPLNYGTTGSPRYPTCAKNFVLYVTDGEPTWDGSLPSDKNDFAGDDFTGTGSSPFNCQTKSDPDVDDPECPGAFGIPAWINTTPGLEDIALYAHTQDLRTSITGEQTLTLFTLFAFGRGSTLLKYAAINGGFVDSNNNDLPDLQSEWDDDDDGNPDNFFEATDGLELETNIATALLGMLQRASSATAASVLASGSGSGANLLQSVFYPNRLFDNDVVAWTGAMQNLWFLADARSGFMGIREDNANNGANPATLHLQNDHIASFFYDTVAQETKVQRWRDQDADGFGDGDGDGINDTTMSTVPFEDLANLWEAGKLLWTRSAATRNIYTTVDGSTRIDFTTTELAGNSTLETYLNPTDADGDGDTTDDAEYILRYARGEDLSLVDQDVDGTDDFRPREVTIDGVTKTWKLGDIINSTPRIVSWVPLNAYHNDKPKYNDRTYGPRNYRPCSSNPDDPDHFVTTNAYHNRGMVFAGANDGMLHAFKLGQLEVDCSNREKFIKAKLTGTDRGKEAWAFIPKNVLPYLKHIGEHDYCHIYSVDMPVVVHDVSIGDPTTADSYGTPTDTKTADSWRTVLIGGMRLGGACKNITSTCTDCVKTPIDGVGYSSYFALDITNTLADPTDPPELLWEYSHPDLGFATSGASVIRVGGDKTKNGHWFAVIGSGPTGPIDTTNNQFLGQSDQNLKLFVDECRFDSQHVAPHRLNRNRNFSVRIRRVVAQLDPERLRLAVTRFLVKAPRQCLALVLRE